MIPIKIECGCGQHYAFDVEPDQGHMPFPVACPACGADGTQAANMRIAQSVAATLAPAVAVAVNSPPVAISFPAAAINSPPVARTAQSESPASSAAAVPRGMASFMPIVERDKAESEARAKIFWGDSREDVVKFLMLHSVNAQEATALVAEMFKERLATIRSSGIRKIVIGVLLMCVPVAAWFIFASIGVIPLKIFAVTVVVGLWGGWMVMKGTFMVASPKTEAGDVADQ